MAKINRSDVIQKAVNDLGLIGNDKIPTETLDKVQLTYDLNRKFSEFVVTNSSTTTGTNTTTLPTVSQGGSIYLVGVATDMIKDATCDQATGIMAVTATPDSSGVASNLIRIPVITLTAQTFSTYISFPYPLKIKPGSTMGFTASFAAGVMSRAIGVYGFTTSSN